MNPDLGLVSCKLGVEEVPARNFQKYSHVRLNVETLDSSRNMDIVGKMYDELQWMLAAELARLLAVSVGWVLFIAVGCGKGL